MVNKRIKKNMLDTIIYTAELWWFIIMTIIFQFIPWLYRWKLLELFIGLIILWKYASGYTFTLVITLLTLWVGIHW